MESESELNDKISINKSTDLNTNFPNTYFYLLLLK